MTIDFNVTFEGSVGAGKSTTLKLAAEMLKLRMPYLRFGTIPEPVCLWQKFYGTNMLERSYTLPQRWGFQFQTLAMEMMVENYTGGTPFQVNLYERLPTTSTSVFGAKFLEDGIFTPEEFQILRRLEKRLLSNPDVKEPQLVLYLRAEPAVVKARISKRNRDEEADIKVEMLEQLNRIYDMHISKLEGPTVITVDANQELDVVVETCVQLIQREISLSNVGAPSNMLNTPSKDDD